MVKENSSSKKTNSTKSITFTIDKKFIALVVLALAALLIFIGIFGDVLSFRVKSGYTSTSTSAINLDFLFRGNWETINRLVDSKLISVGYGYYAKIETILCLASFALALIGVSVTILKHIYYFCNKREFSLGKCFSLLSVFSLQYLALVRLIYSGSSKIIQPDIPTQLSTTGLGWGGILITIGFFFGILATIINDSREKNQIVSKSYIASKINAGIIYFICIFGVTTMLYMHYIDPGQYGLYKTTANSSVFAYFSGLLANNFFTTNHSIITFCLALIALLGSIASFVIFVLVSYYIFNRESESAFNKITKYLIVFLILFVVSTGLLITSAVVYYNANKGISSGTTSYGPGYSTYVGLILIILLIVSVSLIKKWNLEPKSK